MKNLKVFHVLIFSLILSFSINLEGSSNRSKRKRPPTLKELRDLEKRTKLSNDLLKQEVESVDLTLRLMIRKHELEAQIKTPPTYSRRPYNAKTKILTLSDRQIHLNGAVNYISCEHITKRIDFYNNKSRTLPIFLLIDSPGGSVMQGFKILDAIKYSPAPVYVIVKEWAASMAAVILALAEHSFALSNALILFHEPSSSTYGTTSDHREEVRLMERIEERLMGPLMEKFSYPNLEAWRKDLYKHSVSGDWMEFASNAISLKWVNNIVHGIRDTSFRSIKPITVDKHCKEAEDLTNHKEKVQQKRARPRADINYIYNKI